jgi:hypothetical protein
MPTAILIYTSMALMCNAKALDSNDNKQPFITKITQK